MRSLHGCQIEEYLTARAIRQGVAPPTFLVSTDKHLGKRKQERTVKGGEKRRGNVGNRRPMYPVDAEEYDEGADYRQEYGYDDWMEDYERETYAFQSGRANPNFAPCTTPYCVDKNIAHTHTSRRGATSINPRAISRDPRAL
jgi:hypothetical protein